MSNNVEQMILSNLANNLDIVYSFLGKFAKSIRKSGDGKTLRFDIGHDSNAYILTIETMLWYNFRSNEKGNILDLFSENLNISKEKLIGNLYLHLQQVGVLDDTLDYVEFEENYVFQIPETYDKSLLNKYPKVISDLFLKDGIDKDTQKFFDIRYDYRTRRVIIPVYFNNELVGAIGRRNTTLLQEYENKYLPLLTYQKALIFFGYDIYYDLIQKTKTVLIVESEKSVIKMWQMNSKLPTLALGSSSLSRNQIELLKLLQVNTVIFALDKSLEYSSALIPNIQKLKKYGKECTIKYIDVNNIPDNLLGDKESICDRTKEEITEIFTNYLKIEQF